MRAPVCCLACVLLGSMLLGGCDTGRPRRSGPGLVQLDKETHYVAQPTPDGFTLTLYYDHYQGIPGYTVLEEACTARFLAIAQEVATQQGRPLVPVDPASIQRTVSRRMRITTCVATAPVRWQE